MQKDNVHHVESRDSLERRRINNLFCSCFDLLYLILFILIFWSRNLYQQIELEILITLVYFFCWKFYKTSKENPEIKKIF